MADELVDLSDNANWLSRWLLSAPALHLAPSAARDAGFNKVSGTPRDDKLFAVDGKDNVLYGGEGNDTLFAGTGRDILYGDKPNSAASDHKDTFVFKSADVLHKSMKKTDVIADFDERDRIDLSGLTGPKLDFIGKAEFSDDADGEVRFKAFKEEGYAVLQIRYAVNPQITDAVTQVNVKILGDAPAMPMGSLYQLLRGPGIDL